MASLYVARRVCVCVLRHTARVYVVRRVCMCVVVFLWCGAGVGVGWHVCVW